MTNEQRDLQDFSDAWDELEAADRPCEIERMKRKLRRLESAVASDAQEEAAIEIEIEDLHKQLAVLERQDKDSKPAKETMYQRHKREVQEIALGVWKGNPDLTQAAIAQSTEVATYLTTEQVAYDESTLRKWLKQVDPRKNVGPGRPKTSARN